MPHVTAPPRMAIAASVAGLATYDNPMELLSHLPDPENDPLLLETNILHPILVKAEGKPMPPPDRQQQRSKVGILLLQL